MSTKTQDALEIIYKRFGGYPGFEEGVESARFELMIGQIVYDARIEAGLSQAQLAEKAETNEETVARVEEADCEELSLSLLNRIANALNKKIKLEFESATHHETSKPSQPLQS